MIAKRGTLPPPLTWGFVDVSGRGSKCGTPRVPHLGRCWIRRNPTTTTPHQNPLSPLGHVEPVKSPRSIRSSWSLCLSLSVVHRRTKAYFHGFALDRWRTSLHTWCLATRYPFRPLPLPVRQHTTPQPSPNAFDATRAQSLSSLRATSQTGIRSFPVPPILSPSRK